MCAHVKKDNCSRSWRAVILRTRAWKNGVISLLIIRDIIVLYVVAKICRRCLVQYHTASQGLLHPCAVRQSSFGILPPLYLPLPPLPPRWAPPLFVNAPRANQPLHAHTFPLRGLFNPWAPDLPSYRGASNVRAKPLPKRDTGVAFNGTSVQTLVLTSVSLVSRKKKKKKKKKKQISIHTPYEMSVKLYGQL